jgi:iron complex outermembrane receptor protein
MAQARGRRKLGGTTPSVTNRRALAILIGGAIAVPTGAFAQAADADRGRQIEELVVTARRVEENLQKVPVAVTALSETTLRERSIVTPTDLMFAAPSLQMTTAFGRLNGSFSIRGLSGGTQVYFAEIPGGPTQAAAPFYDLANVQVLNGPQGTLFGRANTAGAILITPARPALDEVEGFLDASVGNLNTVRMRGAVSLPIIEGQLAARLAIERTHVDGYTKVLGSTQRVNEESNEGARLSILWKPGDGKFTTYALVDYFHVDEASGGFVLAAANPNLAIFNLPPSLSAPGGLAAGTARFGAVCATAVGAGLSPDLNTCMDQRLRIAATFKPTVLAELARVNAGGNALRYAIGMKDLNPNETLSDYTFVNHSELALGQVGFTTLTIRNIFGFQAARGAAVWPSDGVGGLLQNGVSLSQSIYNVTPSAQQFGNRITYREGPYQKIYSDELQVRGEAFGDLLSWNVGGFYQDTPQPRNLSGIRNASIGLSGITLPTLGWNPSFPFPAGGHTTQRAVFAQATADISQFAPFLDGLHFTAGFRRSWDKADLKTIAVRTDLPSGNYVPTGPEITTLTKSFGDNWTLALDAQVTPDLLIYATTRKGYRPGGVNQVTNSQNVPGFQPTFGPELVKDVEVGAKYEFLIGDVRGRLNVDAYQADYTNIQTTLSVFIGGNTAPFTVNAAAAKITGVEAQGTLLAGNWELNGTLAVADAKFTQWVASDPLGILTPGNPRCQTNSPSVCLIDLSGNPFPNLPKVQGTLTAKYIFPLDESIGRVSVSGTAYYAARRYFTNNAQRQIEEFGEFTRDAISQKAFAKYDLRVDWANINGSKFSGAAFVNNVNDVDYAISALAQLTTIGVVAKLYGVPRTFGLQLRYEY